ncbi:GNAT family N-acetyltransferase [Haloimpatiens massiliensis]|uniref:GNAT family N-acetyltransferase n=1 Tax=Haloimpatiens massiliensis TaxID=1658110 RepID=UPI000C861ACE|nr:GNAT family protein [Haloimpatiens massiliensis]
MFRKNLLKGRNIRLTSVKESDLQIFEQWYNDLSFLRVYDTVAAFPRNEEELKYVIKKVTQSNDSFIFAVRDIENDKFIGVTGFENIQWNNGVAVIYIGIGDDEYRGKGIGKEALALTMNFGFQELNLHRIQLNVLSYNKPAINLYEKLGFKREGTYREFVHRDGKRDDMYLYGILRYEWEAVKSDNNSCLEHEGECEC